MGRRGSVLLQVLVFGMVVAIVAALLMRMSLMTKAVGARSVQAAQAVSADRGALAALMSAWNASGACSSAAGVYNCRASGACGCVCTPVNSGDPLVTAAPSPVGGCPSLKLSIQSQ